MSDKIIGYSDDGHAVYDNTPTVVAALVPHNQFPRRFLIVRRGHEPGKGKLALPGGFHMRGETWQEAGAREVGEETGYVIPSKTLKLIGEPVTDEYGNNLFIAKSVPPIKVNLDLIIKGEVTEILWMTSLGDQSDWAFPKHYAAAVEFFEGAVNKRMDNFGG